MPSRKTARAPKREFDILITWTAPDGTVHVPPDPPLEKGYPPWMARPNEYRRDTPLKKCPDIKCRRAGKCLSLLYQEFCQKTHMHAEEFRAALVLKIDRLMTEKLGDAWPSGPRPPDQPICTPPRAMKIILEKAMHLKHREALLQWQTVWIERRKAEYAANPPKSRPQTSRNNHPLT